LIGPEKRRKKAIRTENCLSDSEFSLFRFFSEHRSEGGALVKAGPIVGVAFFWLLFLAKQEKVTAPRHERNGGQRANAVQSNPSLRSGRTVSGRL
jgi:hypothetical protein